MSETATCTPGQEGSEAIAPMTVTLQPTQGSFPSTMGNVRLISNTPNKPSARMTIQAWHTDVIVAWLPERNPGPGTELEDFTVEIKSGETIFEANPVWVIGPLGSGYPPTHRTAGMMPAARR